MRTHSRTSMFVVLLALAIPSVVSAQSAALSLSSATGTAGSTVTLSVLADTTHPADAFSFGVLHSSTAVSVTAVGLGSAITALQAIQADVPQYYEPNLAPNLDSVTPTPAGAFTVGVILDFDLNSATQLPVGTGQEILTVDVAIDVAATAGTASLDFSADLGLPTVDLVFVLSVPNVGTGLNDPVEVVATTTSGTVTIADAPFMRGDVNDDGGVSLVDGILVLYRMFNLQPAGTCRDAEDINDDGTVSLLDPVYLFDYLFASGPEPLAPFGACADDGTPTDLLGCVSTAICP